MSEYGKYTPLKLTPLLSHDSVKETKEARRKILEAVFQRRRENYKQFMEKKRRLQVNTDFSIIAP